jgi:hypothetical protein
MHTETGSFHELSQSMATDVGTIGERVGSPLCFGG